MIFFSQQNNLVLCNEWYNKINTDRGIKMSDLINGDKLNFKFEQIIAEIFSSYGFSVSHTGEIYPNKNCDLYVVSPEKKFAVEVKLFRNIKPNSLVVISAAERICRSAEKNKYIPIIVLGNVADDSLRSRLKDYPKLIVLDIRNLLYLVNEDEELKSDLLSVLSFSVDDLVLQESEELRQYDFNKLPPKEELHKGLINRIKQWDPSKKENTSYEKLCMDAMKYLFDEDLSLWQDQQKSNDDLFRFDLICKIKDGTNKEFWGMAEKHFGTKYIIFEFKNYNKEITQKEIFTTEKYLYLKALRGIAIIVSTKGADKNADKVIRGTLRENGKLIISLTNEELVTMIEGKATKGYIPADFLSEKLDNMLVNLEK